nr:NAD-dependent epimerase/dehydratase family protein [Legionella jordanis]
MMKIAITGANSFIGQHLLKRLADEPVQVNALFNKSSSLTVEAENINWLQGNLLIPTNLNELLRNCDVVINLAYLWQGSKEDNLNALENLARLCIQNKVKRFIHCSTSSVYGSLQAKVVDENSPCIPKTDYAKTKLEMEKFLLNNYSSVFEVAIIRPTQVFGPGGRNLIKLADDIKYGSRIKNYFKSCLLSKRNMNLVPVQQVVEALCHLVQVKPLTKHIYLVSDDENTHTYSELEAYLMKRLNSKPYKFPKIPLPLFLYKNLYRLLGRGKINPKMLYLGKNLQETGYNQGDYFKTHLDEFIHWYQQTHKQSL